MTFERHDLWLVAALVVGCFAVYAVSRWLTGAYRARAIQKEIDSMPAMNFDHGVTMPARPVLPFARRRLTPEEDRFQRLSMEGLVMSPFDLDGHRRDVR